MEWLGYPVVQSYQGLDISSLPLNHAWVTVNTSVSNVSLFSVRDDCFNCPYELLTRLKVDQSTSFKVDTSCQASWRIMQIDQLVDWLPRNDKTGWLCQMRPTLDEFGVYRLDIGKCEVKPEVPPIHSYFPLLLCMLIFLGLFAVSTLTKYLWRRKYQKKEEHHEKVLQITCDVVEEATPTLHVFRGLLLCLIIFVTTGGGGYPLFNNNFLTGLTFGECLYFAYLWSIGMNIPIIMDDAFKGKTKCRIVRDIFVRSFFLVLLGTAIDSVVSQQLLYSPLQKMGIAYCIVASAYVLTVQRFEMESKKIICKAITNLICLLWCWIIVIFLVAIMIILINALISFNCMSNVGLADKRLDNLFNEPEESQNCNNQVTLHINMIFTGEYAKMVGVNEYIGFSGGVLGMLSAVIYMMIGLKAGVVYRKYQSHSDRLILWSLWATLFGLSGICFGGVSFPLNLNLWPVSSILVISTLTLYIFCITYLFTEVWKLSSSVLSSFGITSIVIFCGHLLFSNGLPFYWNMQFNRHIFYLLQNFWILLLWFIVAMFLARRNVRFDI